MVDKRAIPVEDLTVAKWNMMLEELKVIDYHRKEVHTYLPLARYDFNYAFSLYDALEGWYAVMEPLCGQADKVKFENLLTELDADIHKELPSALMKIKNNVPCGVSDSLRLKLVKMRRELYALKQKHGLGIQKVALMNALVKRLQDAMVEDRIEEDALEGENGNATTSG